MLVITRRKNESILIDNDINIKILEIRGSHVKVGIDAVNRNVIRDELHFKNEVLNRKGTSS